MKKRLKHDYTSNLELKSLLIRLKNHKFNIGTEDKNNYINRLINVHTKLSAKKYTDSSKKTKLKKKLNLRIVELSEKTRTDKKSYEKFGSIILLMIKNILKKSQFSGYTYRDDFYSESIYNIMRYFHNFDHTLISERTGQPVNAFSYITQIIHNSIIFVLNLKKKESTKLLKEVGTEMVNHNLQLKNYAITNNSTYEIEKSEKIEIIKLKKSSNLVQEIKNIAKNSSDFDKIEVIYSKDYRISFEEYEQLKPLLKGKIQIIREREENDKEI